MFPILLTLHTVFATTTTTTTRLNDRILLNVLERGEAAEEKRATEGDGGYKVIRGN